MERLSLAWQRRGVSLGHDVKQQRWKEVGRGKERKLILKSGQ